ncbi:unnamed protein product [Blepharisma stoltei]|uniref:Uncharacterized protein n=1 Tax=Blepharisma stoltei TaxID=1481888 RepID=A0AAU9IFF8_9CILI|nr:unnamed protein product [Blepharisma stoltei]
MLNTNGRQRNLNTLMPMQLKGQGLSRISSTCTDESTNSFLVEIDYNHDVDGKIRDEIDARFNRSPTNAHYKFPREKEKIIRQLPVINYRSLAREKTIEINRRKDSLNNSSHRMGNITEFLNKSLKSSSPTRMKKSSPRNRIGKTPSPLSTVLFNLAPITSATPSSLTSKHRNKHSGFQKLPKEFRHSVKSPSPAPIHLYSVSPDLKKL